MNLQDQKYCQKSKSISSAEPNYSSQFEMRYPVVAEKEESLAAQLFGPGIVSSPKGYTNTIKIYYLLKIIASYPSLATEDLSSADCQKLNDICDSLKEAIKI